MLRVSYISVIEFKYLRKLPEAAKNPGSLQYLSLLRSPLFRTCPMMTFTWTTLFLPYDIQADGALDINSIFETLRKLEGPASVKVVKIWRHID